jgi:hypothetical protein
MQSPGPQSLSFGSVLLMLFIDVLWISAVACYVELVFPGEFGVPLHPLFPFIWVKNVLVGRSTDALSVTDLGAPVSEEFIMAVDEDAVVGLSTDGLTKIFPARESGGTPLVAVSAKAASILIGVTWVVCWRALTPACAACIAGEPHVVADGQG